MVEKLVILLEFGLDLVKKMVVLFGGSCGVLKIN